MATKKTTLTSNKRGKQITQLRIPKRDYSTHLVVQFREGINVPYSKDAAKSIKDFKVGPWEKLEKKYPGITISPLFSSVKPEILKRLISKAKEMDPTYKEGRFFQYFSVVCPVESKPLEILEELSEWNNIKTVKIASKYTHPSVSYNDEDRAGNQNYLDEATISGVGIGAKNVWDSTTILGSDGDGIRFVDIEKGWTLDHEDLGLAPSTLIGGTIDDTARADGTSVLGIICATDNGDNCIGIAPKSAVKVIAYSDTPSITEYSLEDAIILSLTYLGFGDVLLVEAQKTLSIPGNDYDGCNVPVEVDPNVFDAIRLATALGIVVIEPGGDGDNSTTFVNFDELQIGGQYILYPSSTQYHGDSGAIFVTAAHSDVTAVSAVNTHEIMPWAPKGERIDCYAWGEFIYTLSSDSSGAIDQYTDTYRGTSGAAAIIAGAVLNMQSMAVAGQGYRFSPLQIRNILRDSTYGTPLSHDPGIGTLESLPIYMPNLYQFAEHALNTLPDIYLRDFVGDNGEPHEGAMAWSPDIIIKNSEVPDPAQYFLIDNPDNNSLSDNPAPGANCYLYFRALNRGGITATGVKVRIFYTDPSTLITPQSLIEIGVFDFPDIPTGDILTLSSAQLWTAPSTAGHYCFVAFITCDQDKYFDPMGLVDYLTANPTSWTWNTYFDFIRNNNNVTWKNFDIVEMKKSSSTPIPEEEPVEEEVIAPDPDPIQEEDPINENEPTPGQEPGTDPEELPKDGWLRLDFFSPGLPDRDQKMSLEVLSKLPKGVKVLLQIPIAWKKTVFRGSPYVLHNKKRKVGFAPIKPLGKSKLENITFRANSKTALKLFVHVPEKLKKQSYIIAVRQMLEGKEVGRFTWKLVPPKKRELKPIKKPVKRAK